MIREYQIVDKPKVLKIFQLNTPKYFALEEEQDLEHYLDHELDGYFVYELEGKVVGAGGYNVTPIDGRLSWYFIDPQHQGKGIGQALAYHALNLLKLERPSYKRYKLFFSRS